VKQAGITLLVLTLLPAGCRERLTAPADCPALCPGGQSEIIDEVFAPILGADSSFRGYVHPVAARALLVSNGLRGFEERAIMRFPRRADSVTVRDTLRGYTIDSVALGFTLVARDTNLTGLNLLVYRLPPQIDSTTTYAQVDPAFVPQNLVVSIPIPDTLNTGTLRALLQGPDLDRIAIPPADTGVLALGLRLDAPDTTGIRLGASTGGNGGVFLTYATLQIPDTGTTARLRSFPLTATVNASVSPVSVTDDPNLLAVGGSPSARALLRFELPPRIRDSATVIRASLELTPVTPIRGLPTDPVRLHARGVQADLGAKSPVESRVVADTLEAGTTGVVSIEIVRLMQRLWLGNSTTPTALVLSLAPELEAASFSDPIFYSTRSPDPALHPRLRISYLRSFPFENP
jgi:hypothetical protein